MLALFNMPAFFRRVLLNIELAFHLGLSRAFELCTNSLQTPATSQGLVILTGDGLPRWNLVGSWIFRRFLFCSRPAVVGFLSGAEILGHAGCRGEVGAVSDTLMRGFLSFCGRTFFPFLVSFTYQSLNFER